MKKERKSHFDSTGNVSMVGNGDKPVTERTAVARGKVTMQRDTLELIKAGEM